VRNGIAAARLAHEGLIGPHAFITGPAGLYAVHYPKSDVDPESITQALGREYLGQNLGFKAYPCGIVAHPAIDAVRSVRNLMGERPVQAIEVDGPPSLAIMAEPIEGKRAPRTATEAQFSLPWAIACAIRDDALTVDHYSGESLADPELRRLAQAVTVRLSPDQRGTAVRIVLTDDSVLETEPILLARGHPENPLPASEIAQLFLNSARRAAVPESGAGQALALLHRLSVVPDVDEIFSLLAGTLPG